MVIRRTAPPNMPHRPVPSVTQILRHREHVIRERPRKMREDQRSRLEQRLWQQMSHEDDAQIDAKWAKNYRNFSNIQFHVNLKSPGVYLYAKLFELLSGQRNVHKKRWRNKIFEWDAFVRVLCSTFSVRFEVDPITVHISHFAMACTRFGNAHRSIEPSQREKRFVFTPDSVNWINRRWRVKQILLVVCIQHPSICLSSTELLFPDIFEQLHVGPRIIGSNATHQNNFNYALQ